LTSLLSRFEEEVPKFSPRYAGHMLSEISLPALLGHLAALLHNPNNVSRESSKVGVVIERSAIGALAKMIGFSEESFGHFTSGGTIANFEALYRAKARSAAWLAHGAVAVADGRAKMSLFSAAHLGWEALCSGGKIDPSRLELYQTMEGNPFDVAAHLQQIFHVRYRGPVILVPSSRHYSWDKGATLLGLGDEALWTIQVDTQGRLDVADLKAKIALAEAEERPILMVVSIAGTTELGQFDPVSKVQDLLDELARTKGQHIWHHVDAAYGGFFCTVNHDDESLSKELHDALRGMSRVTSLTLDPHKLGFVPYSSGVILVPHSRDYYVRSQDAPYLHFSAEDRGPYTLEGSRAATGAAATWMTSQVIGLDGPGYGRILSRTIEIRKKLQDRLLKSGLPVRVAPGCESNILCFTLSNSGEKLSTANSRVENLYTLLSPEAKGPFVVAKTSIRQEQYPKYFDNFSKTWNAQVDCKQINLLRMCLINPFFDSKEMDFNFTDEFVNFVSRYMDEI
jgi:glutamate/tyrosine decarboxylase-like PLP-dependent enzyme